MASPKRAIALLSWMIQAAKPDSQRPPPTNNQNKQQHKQHHTKVALILKTVLARAAGKSAALALELLARLLLLLLALLLSWSPNARASSLCRLAAELRRQSQIWQNLGVRTINDAASGGADERVTASHDDARPLAAQRGTSSSAAAAAAATAHNHHSRPSVLIVGEAAVGKASLARALRPLALDSAIDIIVQRNLARQCIPPQMQVSLGIVVWEASLELDLSAYAKQYEAELAGAVGKEVPIIVVCNKTDAMPCPLPQITALNDAYPFLAVSSGRRTNLRHLWKLVEAAIMPPPTPPLSSTRPIFGAGAGVARTETPEKRTMGSSTGSSSSGSPTSTTNTDRQHTSPSPESRIGARTSSLGGFTSLADKGARIAQGKRA